MTNLFDNKKFKQMAGSTDEELEERIVKGLTISKMKTLLRFQNVGQKTDKERFAKKLLAAITA